MIPTDHLPTISAERVRLRWLADEDVDALFTIFSDADVIRYWSSPALTDRSGAQKLLHEIRTHFQSRDLFQWGVARIEDDRLIGTCTLAQIDRGNRRAEIGFALGREYWGKGYMGQALRALLGFAFGTMKLNRIEADVDPRNAASLRILERLGFRREGYLRERWILGGEKQDTVLLGLLAGEYNDGA